MRTYEWRSKGSLGVSTSDWNDLEQFLTENQQVFEDARDEYGIEEDPPKIIKNQADLDIFAPGGWLGQYPGGIQVSPDKLSFEEYEDLLESIAGWFEILSVPTVSALVPHVTDVVSEPRSMLLAYSSALIDYTESVLAYRPHVEVEWEQEHGFDVNGQLDVQRTIHTRTNGSRELVSHKPRFTTDTLPNKLLIRFHARLAQDLNKLQAETQMLTEVLERHLLYHRQFVVEGLPGDLFEKSLDIAFIGPDVLAETRNAATGTMAEIVDLWEAYLQDIGFEIGIAEQLTVGVKPISKLYELWVFNKIVDIVESTLAIDAKRIGDGISKFAFGPAVQLFYDQPMYSKSQVLNDLVDYPGRPDFVLIVDNQVKWIGDAKYRYRETIGLEDYQRLFGYGVDLFDSVDSVALSIIHIGSTDSESLRADGLVPVAHHPLKPGENHTKSLSKTLTQALSKELSD